MPLSDPIKRKEYDRLYHKKNRDRWLQSKEYQREKNRRYRLRHPERVKEQHKKQNLKNLGMRQTKEWRENSAQIRLRKLEAIAGRKKPEQCELCGSPDRIFFDHNHLTGNFRGWICSQCNSAIGYAHDNPAILQKMIDYLNREDTSQKLETPVLVNDLIKIKFPRKVK